MELSDLMNGKKNGNPLEMPKIPTVPPFEMDSIRMIVKGHFPETRDPETALVYVRKSCPVFEKVHGTEAVCKAIQQAIEDAEQEHPREDPGDLTTEAPEGIDPDAWATFPDDLREVIRTNGSAQTIFKKPVRSWGFSDVENVVDILAGRGFETVEILDTVNFLDVPAWRKYPDEYQRGFVERKTNAKKGDAPISEAVKNRLTLDKVTGRGLVFNLLADEFIKKRPVITLEGSKKILFYENGIYPNIENELAVSAEILELGASYDLPLSPQHIDSIIKMVQIKTSRRLQDIESHPETLATENGVLNVLTREFFPHDPERIHFQKIPVIYDPEAEPSELFKRYLKTTFKGVEWEIDLIQEMIGYCLYKKYTNEAFFCLYGAGENGKTTLLTIINAFLGEENISSLSIHDITKPPDSFTLMGLFGKLANTCGEIGDRKVRDTSNLKKATGRDRMRARDPFKKSIEFLNYAKIILAMNNPPEIEDFTDGFKRRLKLVSFPNAFREGAAGTIKNLDQKLTTPEELSGVLNWSLDGLARLLEKGKFSYDLTHAQNGMEYDKKSRPVYHFVHDCIIDDPGAVVLQEEVLQVYVMYANVYGLPIQPQGKFKDKFIEACAGISISTKLKQYQKKKTPINTWVKGNLPKKPLVFENVSIDYEYLKSVGIDIPGTQKNITEAEPGAFPVASELFHQDLTNFLKTNYPMGRVGDPTEAAETFCLRGNGGKGYNGYYKEYGLEFISGMIEKKLKVLPNN